MIKDIKELNFPAYATLETASATIADMGDRTITSQVKIDGDVVPDFSYDWEVEFKGERYIHPVKTPQGTKDNTSRKSKIDLVFQHWAIYEMKRQYFVEMASTSAGTAIADKYIASLGLNLGDFVTAFNLVLNHYFDDRIVIRLNPEWQYDAEAQFVSISYSYIWDVLQQMHEIYGVRWTLKTNADGVCEILMGYPAEEVSHIFEYGFEGGLLSVQRQVQSTDIRNRLLGRGGSKNLPYRYFKDKDPNNPLFEADPDWIPELANIAFTELRGKTFRDYVRGWKAKRYGGTPMDNPTEAYLAGYNAEKFDPIEYVDDKESIEKYGVLVGALENNEEIYPSIQGAPGDVDMIVDAEQVTDDDVDAAVENDSVTTNLKSGYQTYRNAPANSTVTIETLTKRYFSVPEGKVGNLSMSLTATGKYSDFGDYEETYPILKTDTIKVTIHDKTTGAEVKSSSVPVANIPSGDYYYMISADVETNYDRDTMVTLNIESVYLYTSTPNKSEGWKQTFDIWVRNIWGSSRNSGETDQQYADRVWAPILGDRMGGEARVVFSSGWLSFSSDWEFPIVGYAYDDSKEGSYWRLTLAKSEAELEASGKYIPYEGYNASAGDRFFFIGIDMPYQYVLWAEEKLDDFKRDSLLKTAEINPTWVIKTDKVRLNEDRNGYRLIDSLSAGSQIRLASKQFISGAYETLYVQSITYTWGMDTILHPNVEIVVSDKVYAVKNPVAQIQSNIESIQRQVGSLSNIQQIIRQVCDKLYLRKDGVSDVSKSPTKFLGKVTGENFRQGQIGGRDWGIYRDENGNAILEADKLVARQGILVTDLVVNEATYVGGLQIRSAAHMDVTSVEDTVSGYVCSFDQKQGSVTNKFKEDDVVLCQKFDADQSEVKFYKRRVVSVSETTVTLSKIDVNGTGVPAEGDVIIHYGNYTDKSRQFVIISDVIGGGYERMLMGLDSVASDGVEYYFAGKSADSKARWFVGGAEQYAEYKDGQLTIKGNIFVTGSDKNISEQLAQLDFIREAFGENAQGLILGTAIIVGYSDENENFVPMAGLSGVYNNEAENGGPAAWYGGTPDDAKAVIFMDGTGYFAGGNIRWGKDGGAEFGGGDFKILPDGSIVFGKNIKISTEGDETLESILNTLARLNNMFYITEDGESIGTRYNLFSEKEVSSNGLSIGSGGSGSGLISQVFGSSAFGTITSESNSATFNAYAIDSLYKRIVSLENKEVDLTGYATEAWVIGQGFITSAALSPYLKTADANSTFATLVALNALSGNVGTLEGDVSTLSSNLNTLKGRFDALDDALNDDVSGKINTWNEIVDFLDEYSGSEDLATVLSGMNADIASRLKSSDFDAWKTDVYSPLATRVSTAEGNISTHTTQISGLTTRMGNAETNISTNAKGIADNKSNISANATAITNLGKRVTANEGNIAEILKWFAVDSDGNLYTTYNLYSTKEISANGLSVGSGDSGGGLISQVYGTTAFGTIAAESNSATFNAYAIDSLYKRIVSLEGKATAVSFVPALTSGKQIGTLSIDGVSTVLYGVDAYSKAEVDSTFLKLSGGTITLSTFDGLILKRNDTSNGSFIAFENNAGRRGLIGFAGNKEHPVCYLGTDSSNPYILYHSGNFNPANYLPLTGGSMVSSTNGCPLYLANTKEDWNTIGFKGKSHDSYAYLGLDKDSNFFVTTTGWGASYFLIHSGNYNSYAPKLDGTGATGTWGINISGTAASLQNHVVFGLVSNSTEKWKQFAKIELSGKFSERSATFQLRIPSSSHSVGASCEVYVMMYQQAEMGSAPQYSVQTNCDDRQIKIAAILNYSSTSSSITLYAYCPHAYTIITVSTLSRHGSDVSIGSEMLSELPSGTQIAIEKMGTSYSTTKLATARTIWGQSFDGSRNVTGNLKVGDGYLYLNNNKGLYSYGTDGAASYVAGLDSSNNYLFGHGQYATTLRGKTISLAYGTSHTTGFILNSSGNVTIGSSDLASTTSKLYVDGLITSSGASTDIGMKVKGSSYTLGFIIGAGNTNRGIYDYTNNSWLLYRASTTDVLIPQGNVGIGTNAPAFKLHVNGTVRVGTLYLPNNTGIYAFASDNTSSFLVASLGSDDIMRYGYASKVSHLRGNSVHLLYGSSHTTGLLLNSSGNVTIGTSDLALTSHKLYVNGSIYADSNILLSNRLLAKSGVFCSYESTCGAYMEAGADGTYAGIYTCNNGAWQSSNIYLHNNGNVTINKRLVVNSSANFKSTLSVAGNINISTIGSAANNNAGYMQGGTTLMRYNGSEFGNLILSGSGGAMYFRPNGTTNTQGEMTLDGNGILKVMGRIEANAGVKVASGQALTFLDASGKEHKLTYDSTAGAFKFDGNVYATQEVSANGISTSGTIETTTNVNLSIDALMTLSGRTDVAQSTMDVYGLTTDVVYGMLAGKYNKILGNSNTAGIWDYDCWQSNTGNVTINLKQGDGININQTIVLKQVTSGSSPVWSVTFLEI